MKRTISVLLLLLLLLSLFPATAFAAEENDISQFEFPTPKAPNYFIYTDGDATIQDMAVEGRKNHAVVTICAGEHDALPDPDAVIDLQNTSILAIPHRLQSRKASKLSKVQYSCGFSGILIAPKTV